jgi:hypothetical protein
MPLSGIDRGLSADPEQNDAIAEWINPTNYSVGFNEFH